MKKIITVALLLCAIITSNAQSWHQVGFKISTSFPTSHEYSTQGDYLAGLFSADFGVYFRAGKIIYGEVGIGYGFYKCDFNGFYADGTEYKTERVELRHLQIPIKAVADIKLTQTIRLMPFAGIIYQPLLKVTDNLIGMDKNTLTCHPILGTAGLDFKLGPIVLGVNYRYSFSNFFQNKEGEHPQYINICAGFQF